MATFAPIGVKAALAVALGYAQSGNTQLALETLASAAILVPEAIIGLGVLALVGFITFEMSNQDDVDPPLPIAFDNQPCCQPNGLNTGWQLVGQRPDPLEDLEYQ